MFAVYVPIYEVNSTQHANLTHPKIPPGCETSLRVFLLSSLHLCISVLPVNKYQQRSSLNNHTTSRSWTELILASWYVYGARCYFNTDPVIWNKREIFALKRQRWPSRWPFGTDFIHFLCHLLSSGLGVKKREERCSVRRLFQRRHISFWIRAIVGTIFQYEENVIELWLFFWGRGVFFSIRKSMYIKTFDIKFSK